MTKTKPAALPLTATKPAFISALESSISNRLNLYQMIDLALKHGPIDPKIKDEVQAANSAFYSAMFGRDG